MAVDFAHPVITDLYSAAPGSPDWPTYIQDNIAAVASWLEGADPAGKRTGFKRITAAGEIEQWNGSAWVRKALNYFSNTGGLITGNVYITKNPPPQLTLMSGSAAAGGYLALGRTAAEGYIGITGQNNGVTNGDVPGDMTIRNDTGRIFLSLGASGHLSISATNGIVAGGALSAIGSVSGAAPYTGMRLGQGSGNAYLQFSTLGAGADNKFADLYLHSGGLVGRFVNDAYNAASTWIDVPRNGLTIGYVCFPPKVHIGTPWVSGPNFMLGVNGAVATRTTTGSAAAGYSGVANTADTWNYGGLIAFNYGLQWGDLPANSNGPSAFLTAYGDVVLLSQQITSLVARQGRVGIARHPLAAALEVAGSTYGFSSEGFRIVHDNGYISWYNAANTARLGYLQLQAAGNSVFAVEGVTGQMNFNIGAATPMVISQSGVYNGNPVEANRLTRTNEFSITSAAASVPNIRYRHGRIAAVIGGAGTITFSAVFSSIYSCVATLEGGGGSGWLLRISNVTTSGFSYAFDNWNSAGSGVACFINYRAVGV